MWLRDPHVQTVWQVMGNFYGYNPLEGPCDASLLGGSTNTMPPGRSGAVGCLGGIPDCQDYPFPARSWLEPLHGVSS